MIKYKVGDIVTPVKQGKHYDRLKKDNWFYNMIDKPMTITQIYNDVHDDGSIYQMLHMSETYAKFTNEWVKPYEEKRHTELPTEYSVYYEGKHCGDTTSVNAISGWALGRRISNMKIFKNDVEIPLDELDGDVGKLANLLKTFQSYHLPEDLFEL